MFEILVAVSIVAICVTIVTLSFSKINENKALDSSVSLIASIIDEARSLTLSGKDASQYGVYLGEGETTLFRGAIYSSSNPENIITPLHSLTEISNVNLTGGGRVIVFQRLSGATTQSGTIEIRLKSSPSITRTISVNLNGIAEEN